MITDERFWSVIDQARAGGSASASPERLSEILNRLSDDEILHFGHMFYEKICDLNKWRLWAAGYVIAGGMSDDSFHYFRSWIVGKGKNAFEVAMTDPDDLGPLVDNNEVDRQHWKPRCRDAQCCNVAPFIGRDQLDLVVDFAAFESHLHLAHPFHNMVRGEDHPIAPDNHTRSYARHLAVTFADQNGYS